MFPGKESSALGAVCRLRLPTGRPAGDMGRCVFASVHLLSVRPLGGHGSFSALSLDGSSGDVSHGPSVPSHLLLYFCI